ncbi:MAG: PQQ-binding-like beta-propeller repeat protein [Verrucomicrobiales bacterium]
MNLAFPLPAAANCRHARCGTLARSFSLGVALFLPLLTDGSLRAEDWPTYRGDNARSGASKAPVGYPLRAVWSSSAPAVPQLAWSSAEGRTMEGKLIGHRVRFDDAFRTVISDGRVYFGSTVDHQVHCLDLASGETLWTFFTGGPVRLAPTVSGTNVLFGSDDGKVYCLDRKTGGLQWQRLVAPAEEWLLSRGEMISKWPVRTSVLVHGGVAYYGAGIFPHENVYLEGVDAKTGERVWRADNLSAQDAGRDDLSPQGYLLATDDLLVVPSGRSLPAVFDLRTGEQLHKRNHSWRTAAGGVVGGTRAILADGQVYTSGPHHFLAIDERSGDTGFAWVKGRRMSIQDDRAYVTTGERVARLDRQPYAENSQVRQSLEMEIYKAKAAGRGAVAAKKAELAKQIEAAQKEIDEIEHVGVDWEVETSDDMALVASAEHVWVGGLDRVTVYRKEDGEKLGELEVEGEARGLAVSGEHLIVSTDAGIVTCFGPPETAAGTPTEWVQGAGEVEKADPLLREAAREILEKTGVSRGFCLVLGSERGDLALELARHSELKLYCVEPDAERVRVSRERLQKAGLYGHRVVVHQWDAIEAVPYANYFANLVVSEDLVRTGTIPDGVVLAGRHVKPIGGILCLGRPASAGETDLDAITAALATAEIAGHSTQETVAGYALLTRGALPGAGNWSHQYGNPDNTAVSRETRVAGDLGVLWYGDPGEDQAVNRHEGAVGPLAVDGRLFVQGERNILAYDAYNGVHLWTEENPEAVRTGVFQNQNPGNLAAGEGSLFHFYGDVCYQIDQKTGEPIASHSLPEGADEGEHEWGYVAIHDGVLYGTATVRKEIEERARRRGRVTDESTDSIFAIDVETGRHLWSYRGTNISHHTIAIGDDKVCFIDSSLTAGQREERLREDKTALAALTGEERDRAEARLKEADLRMAVALDARTGEKKWDNAVDVTDCSDIGIGGGRLTMMYADGKLVLCGANANGHYWKQFMDGEFERRRIVALSAENGYQLWGRDANYLHRPIVLGDRILAEPWQYDLETGEQITRSHPVTGEAEPWSMMRTGHHCGMVTGSDSGMLLFRSGFTGFANLFQDDGIRHFSGHRLGCWINAVAANGLVMIPEASAGCVCQFSLASTIVLEPRESRRPWSVFSAVGALVPARHLAVNFGAPGDRRDALDRLWLSYPRYLPYKKTSLEVDFDLKAQFAKTENPARLVRSRALTTGGVDAAGYGNIGEESSPPIDAETPWLYQSWAEGITSLELPLTEPGGEAATYTLRLHFADLARSAESATPAEKDFHVILVTADGGERKVPVHLERTKDEADSPVVVDIADLQVAGSLRVAFDAEGGVDLGAVEAIRQE